jgi:hypothetical protein
MALLGLFLILGASIIVLVGFLRKLVVKEKAHTKANAVAHNMSNANAAELITGNARNSSSPVNATTLLEPAGNATDECSSLVTTAPNVAPGNDTFLAKLASTEQCLSLAPCFFLG